MTNINKNVLIWNKRFRKAAEQAHFYSQGDFLYVQNIMVLEITIYVQKYSKP